MGLWKCRFLSGKGHTTEIFTTGCDIKEAQAHLSSEYPDAHITGMETVGIVIVPKRAG